MHVQARAPGRRAQQTCNDPLDMKKSDNPETQSRAVPLDTRHSIADRQAQSSLVKPGKAKKINSASIPLRCRENSCQFVPRPSMFSVQRTHQIAGVLVPQTHPPSPLPHVPQNVSSLRLSHFLVTIMTHNFNTSLLPLVRDPKDSFSEPTTSFKHRLRCMKSQMPDLKLKSN